MVTELQYPSPFKTLISFHLLIEKLEEMAKSDVDYRSNYAKSLLKQVEYKPELIEGIQDVSFIKENESLIRDLLSDLFPTGLTNNEIKAVTLPFVNFTFNYTQRFRKILDAAGMTFDIEIRDFDEHQFYLMNCYIILNAYYNQKIDSRKPLFYDIPDENGIMNHYRILYNADFIEVTPTEKMVPLTQDEINQLIDNYDDLELWKEKFPPNSWLLKGFGIVTLVDVTVESAVSNLKTNLLKTDTEKQDFEESSEAIFKSIFRIKDVKIGFTKYDEVDKKFVKPPFSENKIVSYLLCNLEEEKCDGVLCNFTLDTLIQQKQSLIVSNVEDFQSNALAERLLSQNVKSCILAPIVKEGSLLGIIEIASSEPRALNSINANKIDLIMPYIVDTVDRSMIEIENLEEAIIQKEYTTIHSSVYWKFKNEAQNYIKSTASTKDYIFKEITFKEIYPLYGQIDIKGSSDKRNQTVKTDLTSQIQTLINIVNEIKKLSNLMILDQKIFELTEFLTELDLPLKADMEQQIQRFIESEIHPIIQSAKVNGTLEQNIKSYFESLDPKTGMFYHSRKDFDHTLSVINKKMASILDEKQIEAQKIYPHYYERFKTDGVEHNLYIGASIAPSIPFDKMYLNNLRLWQLQALCEMELEHHKIKETLPFVLEVTSLILVFSSPLSIRFRMDEKRFDVDGSYNARYEVVKKRIDKAYVLGTQERITEKEKITIVYSHDHEEKEYLKYIKFLQHKNVLESTIEQFEIEDLQGVSGLRGIRVKVVNDLVVEKKYSYQDLLDELN
ncbi:GAF domain-containing protein [Flavobacterium sp.]|uniref:GAF domain-containing protein n=1 Tax=Flavobacterium sp. TaxID=239 RepID=UPI004047D0FB